MTDSEPTRRQASGSRSLPVDPDIESPDRRPEPAQLRVLVAISSGGVLGATARYAAGVAWPSSPGFPWTTFAINVSGCLLLGLVVVIATEREEGHPLLRPFLGTGVLGGFTSFSTYTVEAHQLLMAGHAATALTYLGATLTSAVLAAAVGLRLGRRLAKRSA